ncbi:MAG: PAS domain S-box protein [Pseudomonadales bacterium]|nr:PAS domain S-box protein [Pseudomonadales bacterium]
MEELQIAIDNSMTGISWVDAFGIFRQVRSSYSSMLGYEPRELEGQSWSVTLPPDAIPKGEQAYLKMLEEGRVVHESPALRKDGSIFHKHILLVKTTDNDGNHSGHYCFMRDITDRITAESAQRHYQELSSLLLDSIQDGLSVIDGQFRHIRVNEAFCKMTGYSEEELIGVGIPHPYWPEEHQDYILSLTQVDSSDYKDVELIFCHKSGKRFPVIVSPFVAKDSEGKQIFVATIKDISGIRETSRRSADSDRLKTIGTLAGGIAHDLNNLLTPILGSADMVMQGGADTSKATEVIHAAAERAKELIEQLLQFSSAQITEKSEVSIEKVLRDAVQFVQGSLPPNVSLKTKVNIENDLVEGVEASIQLLILNLISNAGDAMQDCGGDININLDNPNDTHICLRIKDTGSGIPANNIETIFEAFYTTKAPEEGTGLGLMMVKEAVATCGGTITVQSELGEGSLFTVMLPLSNPICSETADANSTIINENPLRIMVVDDDAAILDVSKVMLDYLGHQSACFNNPMDALKQDMNEYDLLITDYRMNGISGFEFVEQLAFDGPVLLMTGLYDLKDELPSRVNGKLNKPFKLDNLKDAIDSVTQ